MRIVPPEGPTNRPVLALVGEAPGADEERLGRPFVGSSGRLLDQMLAQAGISRGECYITNVSKVRPPSNNFVAMYYDDPKGRFPKSILLDAREQLNKELRAIQPKVIVALGSEALKALTAHTSIKMYRGTMIDKFGLRVLPTYHPAYLLRGMYEERPIVEADLKKAYRQALHPYVPPTYFIERPSFNQVMTFLGTCPPRVTIDIETVNNRIRCIGFAWSKFDAISIPFMWGRSHAWTADQETEILHAMDRFLRNPHIEKVVQNLMYDATIMAREFGLHIVNVVMDTMLSQHLLYPELPKGLDFQSSIYTDHPMYWSYDPKSSEETARYNCYDCVVTYQCAEEHEKEMDERGIRKFYDEVINRAVDRLLYVQSKGVLVDQSERERIRLRTEAEMGEILNRLARTVGQELNPSSPKQVAALVYDKWGLPKQVHSKTKKVTTDDDALNILAKKNPQYAPVIKDILDYRAKRVLIGNFCNMNLRDGRLFTSYNVAGTVTGRLSSSTTFDGLGGNLQNIPRGDFRRIIVPDPGKILIKSDLSQAEYRVLIWKARIKRVIDRWTSEPGFNIHMWNAAENIYRIPVSQVTEQQYSNAKNGVYGANYGIGPHKVSRMYNIEFQEAKFIIERYHEAVPEVRSVYQREIIDEVSSTRMLTNPLGRQRMFFGRMDDELYRAAFSHYAQSTVADLINLGLIDLVDISYAQPDLGLDVLLQVHDEVVCQCWENKLDDVLPILRSSLERPLNIPGTDVPLVIPCGIKIGRNWYDMVSPDKWKDQQNANATIV